MALVDAASRSTQPLEIRQAAAGAFAHSVHRFGLRLAPSEVLRQYDRYNQSATLDKPTQQLLAQILDAIEGPTRVLKKGTGTFALTRIARQNRSVARSQSPLSIGPTKKK